MALFRRNTIFHVEESLPDPEELKLRFRRRVLLITVCGFLAVLGAPVVRDLRPYLNGRVEARHFAESMLEARTLASKSRMPVALEIDSGGQGWKRKFYAPSEGCEKEATGPVASFSTAGVAWKLKAEKENGESVSGHKLCWHPGKGLLLDTVPLANAKLLVSLAGEVTEGGAPQDLAYVLVTLGGAELQTISH
jgi:hypothetical protein